MKEFHMTRFITAFAIAFVLLLAPVRKSEAAVGGLVSLAVSVPAVIAFGGVSTVVGGVAMFVGDRHQDFDKGFFLFFGGAALFVLGIVVLEGEQTIGFKEVSQEMLHLEGVSTEDIVIYNSELDELNAIHREITQEVADDSGVDVKARWQELGSYLSPATIDIAARNSDLLLKSLKTK